MALILPFLLLLFGGGTAEASPADRTQSFTVVEFNNHLETFFSYALQYLEQVYTALSRTKNEFETKYVTGNLQKNGLNRTLVGAAGHYIKIEKSFFESMFGSLISTQDREPWEDYLTVAKSVWAQYYEKYYTRGLLPESYQGFSVQLIIAHKTYWEKVSVLMKRFLNGEEPDPSILDSIRAVAAPDPVPPGLFSQPVTSDTIYIDKMINDAQAIPKIFLREAPTHISIYNSSDLIPGTSSRIPNGEVWASTFANWKAETDLKIQVEDEHVETVMDWMQTESAE